MTCFSCKITKEMACRRIFDRQAQKLLDLGFERVSNVGSQEFAAQLNQLSSQLGKIPDWQVDEIPFLIVVPAAVMPISVQMSLLQVNDSKGRTGLDDKEFRTMYQNIPDKLYLVTRVVFRPGFTGTTSEFGRHVIEQGNYGLLAEEGMALTRNNPGTMLGEPICLVGTHYGAANRICFLANLQNIGIELVAFDENSDKGWPYNYPYCSDRLV